MAATASDLRAIAQREVQLIVSARLPAREFPSAWARFVADCEQRTGLAWADIRAQINPYVVEIHREMGIA